MRSTFWVIVAAVLLASAGPASALTSTTLGDAMEKGLVRARFWGTGTTSGDSIRVTVGRTSKAGQRTITLTIPPGTILRPVDSTKQNMVVAGIRGRLIGEAKMAPETEIVVPQEGQETYVIEAYGTEFLKANPIPATELKLRFPRVALACLIEKAKERNLSRRALQSAIWIQTDKINYQLVTKRLKVSKDDWRAGKRLVKLCEEEFAKSFSGERKARPSAVPIENQRVFVHNQTDELVQVFIRGGSSVALDVPPGRKKVVEIPEGEYEMSIRYGSSGGEYRFGRAKVQITDTTRVIPIKPLPE